MSGVFHKRVRWPQPAGSQGVRLRGPRQPRGRTKELAVLFHRKEGTCWSRADGDNTHSCPNSPRYLDMKYRYLGSVFAELEHDDQRKRRTQIVGHIPPNVLHLERTGAVLWFNTISWEGRRIAHLLVQSRDQIPEQECSGRDYTESVRFDPEDGGGSDWDAETYSGVPVACERNALGRPSRHQSRSCAWTSASGLTAGSREAEEQRLMRTAGKGGGGRKRGGNEDQSPAVF